MKKDVYYGIVMKQIQINPDIYFYFPDHFVEGTIEEGECWKVFIDIYGQEYFLAEDVISDNENNVVSYLIKRKDLIKNVEPANIEKVKAKYFFEARNRAVFGVFDVELNEIDFISLSISEFGRFLSDLSTKKPKSIYQGENLYKTIMQELKNNHDYSFANENLEDLDYGDYQKL